MAQNRDLKYINGGKPLVFDVAGFALNGEGETAIAFAGDYRNQVLAMEGTGTVIVYGSCQKDPPDFTAPCTIDNFYVPIVLADYSLPNTFYPGATGATLVAECMMVELNTNLLSWVAIFRSVNTVEVKLTEADNQ